MLTGDMVSPGIILIFDRGVKIPEWLPLPRSRLPIGQNSEMQRRLETHTFIKRNKIAEPGLALVGFLLQLTWVLRRLGPRYKIAPLSWGRKEWLLWNQLTVSATNLCLDCVQFSVVHWLVSPISFENPEPTVDIATQLYCFRGCVTLEAGLRK